MIWTKEKPTVSGWYWIFSSSRNDYVEMVFVTYDAELGYQITFSGEDFNHSWSERVDDWWWMGPIVPPSSPEQVNL